MDLSKLPKLSQTPVPPSEQSPPAARTMPAAPVGPEVWISFAVGVILLLYYRRFLQWACSRMFGTSFGEFYKPDGTMVPYTQVSVFWSDLGITLFGIALILESLVLAFARRRALIWIVFAFTLGMIGYNLWYLISSYSDHGLAVVSALAVAFGGYIALHQWGLLRGVHET